jgi:hypothetical protein
MRKILGLVAVVCLIGAVGYFIVNCGQQTPSINTISSPPSGLSLRGVIYSTTLDGTRGDPISGAMVVLSGSRSTYTAATNSDGEYVFSGIPDGLYNIIVTAEGHQRNTMSGVNVPIKPSSGVPADNTITVQDIVLSSRPIILSYSPVPNSVISQTPTFVVTFNEAIDPATVIPILASAGPRTYAISGDTVQLSTSWPDSKTLIITPEASLPMNQLYGLALGVLSTIIRDVAGYPLSTEAEQALQPTQFYRVTTGGLPGAPSNIVVTMNGKPFTAGAGGADYSDVMHGGMTDLGIYWDPPSSGGLVSVYKIYAAVGGASVSNYVIFGSYPNITNNYYSDSVQFLINALYGSTPVDPVSTKNYPFINKAVYFKVVAINGDGESAAASTGGIMELVGPQLVSTAYDGFSTKEAERLSNNYYLPALTGTDTKIAYIGFNQPVDPSTITATNFSLYPGTVTDAALLTQSSGTLCATSFGGAAYAVVRITSDTDLITDTVVTAKTGVKDLAGNPVVSGTGDTVTLP